MEEAPHPEAGKTTTTEGHPPDHPRVRGWAPRASLAGGDRGERMGASEEDLPESLINCTNLKGGQTVTAA